MIFPSCRLDTPGYGGDKDFLVGVVTSTSYLNFLSNHTLVLKKTLHVYIADKMDVGRFYPDNISDLMSKTAGKDSPNYLNGKIDWLTIRREVVAEDVSLFHVNGDSHVDIGEKSTSPISDLDLMTKTRELSTFRNFRRNLRIIIEEESVTKPSTLYMKVSVAKDYLVKIYFQKKLNEIFFEWGNNAKQMRNLKSTSAITMQKYYRRYLQRESLNKQRRWKKWWTIHKDFNYVPKSRQTYNVKGSGVHLSLKFSVKQWGHFMEDAFNIFAKYASKSITSRLIDAFRKWRECIARQDKEMALMWNEEIHSFL